MTAIPLAPVLTALNRIILGKPKVLELSLCCMLARGHLLLEDLPGMGKTTLAEALARVAGLGFRRLQFTSDLMPADILGMSVFKAEHQRFEFMPGPVFTEVLLADEINRSSPKTQSALLEAMEEGQVTQEGQTYALPNPFFVIATQNPQSQAGTHPLPESQLDRFLMRLELGYPDARAERELLTGQDRRQMLKAMTALTDARHLLAWQEQVRRIRVSDPLLDYLLQLAQVSRQHPEISDGLSPRGLMALKTAAQAMAMVRGRAFVQPEDIQAVLPAVVDHRLPVPKGSKKASAWLVAAVPVLPA